MKPPAGTRRNAAVQSIKFYQSLITNFDNRAAKIMSRLPEYDAEIAIAASVIMQNVKLVLEKHSEMERMKLFSIGVFLDGGKGFSKRYGITQKDQHQLCEIFPDLGANWHRFYKNAKTGKRVNDFRENYPSILQGLQDYYDTDEELVAALDRIEEKRKQLKEAHPDIYKQLITTLEKTFDEIAAPQEIKRQVFWGSDPLYRKINWTPEQIDAFVEEKSKVLMGFMRGGRGQEFPPQLTDSSAERAHLVPEVSSRALNARGWPFQAERPVETLVTVSVKDVSEKKSPGLPMWGPAGLIEHKPAGGDHEVRQGPGH